MLRARILEPFCDVSSIRNNHECIRELNRIENVQMKAIISSLLKHFFHVDRLHKLALAVPHNDNLKTAEYMINQTVQLRLCLRLVPVVRTKLETFRCKPFNDIKTGLCDERYQMLLDHIDSVLNSNDATVQHSDGHGQIYQIVNCIKSEKNEMIDKLRKIFNNLMDELHGNNS